MIFNVLIVLLFDCFVEWLIDFFGVVGLIWVGWFVCCLVVCCGPVDLNFTVYNLLWGLLGFVLSCFTWLFFGLPCWWFGC